MNRSMECVGVPAPLAGLLEGAVDWETIDEEWILNRSRFSGVRDQNRRFLQIIGLWVQAGAVRLITKEAAVDELYHAIQESLVLRFKRRT